MKKQIKKKKKREVREALIFGMLFICFGIANALTNDFNGFMIFFGILVIILNLFGDRR